MTPLESSYSGKWEYCFRQRISSDVKAVGWVYLISYPPPIYD